MIVAHVFQDGVTNLLSERRRFQRLPIAVQTELRVQGNLMPIRVETADISLGGCYVEMALTLAVGTPLSIVLWLGQEKLAVDGRVATCHPQFGNGIEFTGICSDAQQRLQRFLESASSEDNPGGSPEGERRI
ncbi:MAG: PilZ domain-containing protein [Candidatus Sulfotelmatobacter sp.]